MHREFAFFMVQIGARAAVRNGSGFLSVSAAADIRNGGREPMSQLRDRLGGDEARCIVPTAPAPMFDSGTPGAGRPAGGEAFIVLYKEHRGDIRRLCPAIPRETAAARNTHEKSSPRTRRPCLDA